MLEKQNVFTVSVFVNSDNNFGNPVGIIIDEQEKLEPSQRQKIAKQLNYSETVFIDNINQGKVQIFNPLKPVKFAGHALLGTAWFLYQHTKNPPKNLICSDEKVSIYQNDFYWIRGPLSITPNWQHIQIKSYEEVENLTQKQIQDYKHSLVWAWQDKKNKIIRARTFAPDWGISEDEANGSGSMQLAHLLQSELTIMHGQGSVIHAKPYDGNYVDVGGNCYQL